MAEQRTVLRFRKRTILIHWIHAASTAVLLVTGAIMFFDLTSMDGGRWIRNVHKAAAVFFAAVPVLFSIFDPGGARRFLHEAFHWDRDSLAWLKAAPGYYFGRRDRMPPQGYLNGDQRLWQLVVTISGLVLASTGVLMWFFKLKMSLALYPWILFMHAVFFVLVSLMALIHFYLASLHPRFEESLASMVDGKVSSAYARDHFIKWYEDKPPKPGLS